MSKDFIKLVQYVNAASDLAEQCQKDIKNGKKYTTETVSKLGKFIIIANSFQTVLDEVQKTNIRLN